MSMYRHLWRSCLCSWVVMCSIGVAVAQETTTYTYDAKGRLTNITRAGGPSNGTTTTYTYDPADNRSNVTVSGAANGSGNGSGDGASATTTVNVVVPLRGYTIVQTVR